MPEGYREKHIQLAEIGGQNYIRFGACAFTIHAEDTEITIPAASPWFCLDLVPLIQAERFEEAETQGFILCPVCGSKDIDHHCLNGSGYEDVCFGCHESWHAIGYSWINSLVGVMLLEYGKYLLV